MPVRVASFNIHHGVGIDGALDLERVAATIQGTAAEVVGIQEVDRHFSARSGWVDQAGWLAERLGMHVAFGAAIDREPHPDHPEHPDAPRRQYGNAVLSAYPILDQRNTRLPRLGESEPRAMLETVVDLRGTSIRVASTHLQNRAPVERLVQAMRVVHPLRRSPEPAVLTGDLNAHPGSRPLAVLTRALVDAWAVAGAGDGFTIDAATPHARLDYVLVSSALVPVAASVLASRASDHLPVVVDLALPGEGPSPA